MSTLALFALYSVVLAGSMRWRRQFPEAEFRRALILGIAAGVWTSLQLVVERFVPLQGRWNGAIVLGFSLGMFVMWGLVAFRARRGGFGVAGCEALAILSATVTMSLAVCFGTLLELYLAPVPLESMRSWAEYQRSGWGDLGAFAVANTLDSAMSHLLAAPVVAAVFGGLGVLVASLRCGARGGVRLERLKEGTRVG